MLWTGWSFVHRPLTCSLLTVCNSWGADPHHEAARRNLLEIVETLDPENKSTLREPTPLDDPKGNLMELDGDAPCCIRFGQRRNLGRRHLLMAGVA